MKRIKDKELMQYLNYVEGRLITTERDVGELQNKYAHLTHQEALQEANRIIDRLEVLLEKMFEQFKESQNANGEKQ